MTDASPCKVHPHAAGTRGGNQEHKVQHFPGFREKRARKEQEKKNRRGCRKYYAVYNTQTDIEVRRSCTTKRAMGRKDTGRGRGSVKKMQFLNSSGKSRFREERWKRRESRVCQYSSARSSGRRGGPFPMSCVRMRVCVLPSRRTRMSSASLTAKSSPWETTTSV